MNTHTLILETNSQLPAHKNAQLPKQMATDMTKIYVVKWTSMLVIGRNNDPARDAHVLIPVNIHCGMKPVNMLPYMAEGKLLADGIKVTIS